jgi:hypothetical protein
MDDWTLLDPEFSYFCVGLARGAGSFDAWKRAGVPSAERVFLLRVPFRFRLLSVFVERENWGNREDDVFKR